MHAGGVRPRALFPFPGEDPIIKQSEPDNLTLSAPRREAAPS
jgi:hypothetical protein